jgi:WD40 repeat protein
MKDRSHSLGRLSPGQFLQVNDICERFESAWRGGKRPRLEDYLVATDLPASKSLLQELILIDAECRQAAGEMPCAEDYAERFPDADAAWLAAHLPQAPNARTEQPAAPAATVGCLWAGEAVGSVVAGRFKLLEEIGEGGMGTVWVAEQMRPVRRKVAIKLIKAGMDSKTVLARFEAERQALAMMDHPNIAKVLDGGTTEGARPFFVMEHVKGVPLTKYCDDARLSVQERLALFVPVCQAVQHAHQKGIIHRDLKPSNILVCLYDGKPVPKVIDFGLAKAMLGPLTEHTLHTAQGTMMGTPLYMSPEQAEFNNLDVDTRTDIYSLGVILYELLTGTTPLERNRFKEAAWHEMLRLIKEEEPPKPSARLSSSGSLPNVAAQRQLEPVRLTRLVRGELDWIVMKALEKERSRRYDTANGFARDIQRYLADEAVEACPPSARYRLRKFARKYQVALATAALFLLLLLAGVVVSSWLAIRATEAEADAKEQEKLAKKSAGAALEQEREAKKQADIAKANEDRARKLAQEKDLALKQADEDRQGLRHTVSLDRVLLAQAAFDSGNVSVARERLDEVPADLRGWEWHYLKRLYHGAIFTLYGHTSAVNSISFSPDGTRIATSSWDNSTRVWDARTGTPLLEVTGRSAMFNPDGKRLITIWGNNNMTMVKVWDANTGTALASVPLHSITQDAPFTEIVLSRDASRIVITGKAPQVRDAASGKLLFELKSDDDWATAVAFSSDGKFLVTGHYQSARTWNALTGAPMMQFKGQKVDKVEFSPEGTRLATAGWGKNNPTNDARIWDARTGTLLFELKGHTDRLTSLAFSPDGTRLATTGSDRAAKVWDVGTGMLLLDLKGHSDGLESVAFSPDGTLLVTGSRDKTAKVWDACTGMPMLKLEGSFRGGLTGVAVSPDEMLLAGGSLDGTARVWDFRSGSLVREINAHTATVGSVAFSPDGTRLATASFDKTARIWTPRTGGSLIELKGHAGEITCVAFSPDGTRVVTTSEDKTARIWDARDGTLRLQLNGHTAKVSSAAFSPEGTRLVTGGWDKTARVWDARTGVQLLELKGHAYGYVSWVAGVAFSPDGKQIVTASHDGTAKTWDAHTGAPLLELKGHTAAVNSVAFSPDGARLVTASWDKTAKVWDARTGTPLFELKGHRSMLRHVTFSPDGKRLITSGDDLAKVWDARGGAPLIELTGHAAEATSAAFNSDGTRLATGWTDGTTKVWDTRTGKQLCKLEGHGDRVSCLAFNLDGNRLVTGSFDKTSKVWDLRDGTRLFDLVDDAEVYGVAFNRDGTLLATASSMKPARLWDAGNGMLLREVKGSTNYGEPSVAFSVDGTRLVVGTMQAQMGKVWNVKTGQELSETPDNLRLFAPSQTSSDGRFFAHLDGKRVQIVDRVMPREEREYRLFWAGPRPDVHWDEYTKARQTNDEPVAKFHLDRLLGHYKQAVMVDSRNPQAHAELGAVLLETKDLDGSIAELRRALVIEPRLIGAHKKLALALAENNDLEGAIAEYGQIMTLDPTDARVAEYLTSNLAQRALFAAAARLYIHALSTDPKMADDLEREHRYNAACYAAQAGGGKGNDASRLDDKERARWRQQALDWLRADLAIYKRQLEGSRREALFFAWRRLWHWKRDSDLISIREPEALGQLSPEEGQACRRVWTDVEALIKKMQVTGKTQNITFNSDGSYVSGPPPANENRGASGDKSKGR